MRLWKNNVRDSEAITKRLIAIEHLTIRCAGSLMRPGRSSKASYPGLTTAYAR